MLERAHIVQAVGELDDDYANVGDHGEQHLADVLGLVIFAVGKLDLVQLGDALDDVGHLLAETLFDLVGGDVGVFDGVVQEAGGDGGGIHLQLREHQGDLERMHDVGFAGRPLLPLVMLETELPGLADDFQVVAGAILVDLLEQAGELRVHLADDGRTGSGEVLRGTLRRGIRSTAGSGAGLRLARRQTMAADRRRSFSSMPVSVLLAPELVPSSAEGAALFRFPEAAGVFAIANYRRRSKTTRELYAGEAVSRWLGRAVERHRFRGGGLAELRADR